MDKTGSRSPEMARFRTSCIKNFGFSDTDSVRMLLQVAGPNSELPAVTSGVGKLQDGEEETSEQQRVKTDGGNV